MKDKKEYIIVASIVVIVVSLIGLWVCGVLSTDVIFPLIIIIGVIFYFAMKKVNDKHDIYGGKFHEHFKNPKDKE